MRAAVLVGDSSAFGPILDRFRAGDALTDPGTLLKPAAAADPAAGPDPSASICSCENISRGAICGAIAEGCDSVKALKATTRAGTGCGGCVPLLEDLLRTESATARAGLCEHFGHTRAELYDLIRVRRHATFAEVLDRYGVAPGGCEVCKPTVASILASLDNGYILDGEQAALQDSNDHFLANIQKDGTYSVVPRVPGGEITPEGLIVIGEVARDFDLYTKITGGQRIDLFGARVEQLPLIWRRLVDAGFESGHAYGKSLRTVKSCVGSSWCRYGVQDSTSMAILLEERYRGLRSPHKIKMAVSGCARECAEAQSKDVGRHRHRERLEPLGGRQRRHAPPPRRAARRGPRRRDARAHRSTGSSSTTCAAPTACSGRPRGSSRSTAASTTSGRSWWTTRSAWATSSKRRWRPTSPPTSASGPRPSPTRDRLARFVTFVNAPDEPDPTVVFVRERDQIRPARPDELAGANA